MLLIFAGTKGYLDSVSVADLGAYETELYRFMEVRHAGLLRAIAEKKQLDDTLTGDTGAALKEFGEQFAASRKAA